MKYKVGDKVRVREDLEAYENHCGWVVVDNMTKLKGKTVTIKKVLSDYYHIEEDGNCWTDEMFTDVIFTKADLQEGDRAILRDGKITYFHDGIFDYVGHQLNDDLTNNGAMGKTYDVMKIERPTYQTVYERQEVKEMTVEEVSKALGYEVKIVK